MKYDGKSLINMGLQGGEWFQWAIPLSNQLHDNGWNTDQIKNHLIEIQPVPIVMRGESLPFQVLITPENELERVNFKSVYESMQNLMRVPTVVKGIALPDACPAGIIPVGGVVATENSIHPGFHSADVCCSMSITIFDDSVDLKSILDKAQEVTHFGPGGREDMRMPSNLIRDFGNNPFLKDLVDVGDNAMGTQGDGNHFLFVGRVRSSGNPAIVTHHGSRAVGAALYKQGMTKAKIHTNKIAKGIAKGAEWLDAASADGQDYWEALQIIREWTNENHHSIHNKIAEELHLNVISRFWNEHNFVFKRDDGLFYHAKGATPSFDGWGKNSDHKTLIPMNMAEPILISKPTNQESTLGFAPHGAGRNQSRTGFLRDNPDVQYPNGIDVRFWLGEPDASELPSAYKNAASVIHGIKKDNLTEILDYIDPYGSIMAGSNSQWRNYK